MCLMLRHCFAITWRNVVRNTGYLGREVIFGGFPLGVLLNIQVAPCG